jgi:transposase
MVGSTCTPARWSLGLLKQDGESMLHHHLKTAPEPVLKAMAPSREDLVVCVEGLCTWYGLAELCAREGLPFVLGHALSLQALPGGKAKHDTIDAHQRAVRRRGGMLPQASVYPAQMRATRDLRRRRRHLLRQRAALFAHVHNTPSQYHLPAIGPKIAYQGHRDGVAARWADPAGQQRIAVDLGLITCDDPRRPDLELSLVQSATPHEAHPCYRLRSIPGVGTIFALGRLFEIHDIHRCPRVQAFVS